MHYAASVYDIIYDSAVLPFWKHPLHQINQMLRSIFDKVTFKEKQVLLKMTKKRIKVNIKNWRVGTARLVVPVWGERCLRPSISWAGCKDWGEGGITQNYPNITQQLYPQVPREGRIIWICQMLCTADSTGLVLLPEHIKQKPSLSLWYV